MSFLAAAGFTVLIHTGAAVAAPALPLVISTNGNEITLQAEGVTRREALAGLCLVLPAAARRWAAVAGWAGAILAAEAVVFVVYHLSHGAYVPAGASLVLGLLAAFVAWRRLT